MKNTGGLVNLGAGKWLLVEPDDRIFEHWCTISELHFADLLPSILFQLTNSGCYSCIFSIAWLLLIHKFCFLIILLLPHRFGLCDSPLPLLHCLTSFQLRFHGLLPSLFPCLPSHILEEENLVHLIHLFHLSPDFWTGSPNVRVQSLVQSGAIPG